MKKCSICGEEKLFSEFTISKRSRRTGEPWYKSFCKPCALIYRDMPKGKVNVGQFKKGFVPWNRKEENGKQSKKYYKWRDAVWERDCKTCRECGFSGGEKLLHAHHLNGWNEYPSLRFDIGNGITLCHSCHARRHGRKCCNFLKDGKSWIKGKKMSIEHRKKLSDAHRGKKLSAKHKAALRDAHRRRKERVSGDIS